MNNITAPQTGQQNVNSSQDLARLSLLVLLQNLRPQFIADSFPHETVRRFVLQSTARNILGGFRVSRCLRSPIPTAHSIEVATSDNGTNAHFRNLMTCGSVWVCPVCAAKVTEQRRKELSLGVDNWLSKRKKVALATYTAKHAPETRLGDILTRLKDSKRRFKSGRRYQQLKASFGIVGTITASEITWGKNGWHPHFHEMMFFDPHLTKRTYSKVQLENTMRELWIDSLEYCGLEGLEEIACKVDFGNAAIAEYVTKLGKQDEISHNWTVVHELTKFPSKRAKGKQSVTPQGLLALAYDGNSYAKDLFEEYAIETKGRSQLHWSKGLADLLEIEMLTDEQIAEKTPQDAVLLAEFSLSVWREIMSHEGKVSKRAEILRYANMGKVALCNYILDEFGIVLN